MALTDYDVSVKRVEEIFVSHAVCKKTERPTDMFPIRVPALCGVTVFRFAFEHRGGDFAHEVAVYKGRPWTRICPVCMRLAKEEA